ncbi:MAG: protein translocase subunit SecF, partial [bacterium]|nr:protein translocase subunit SecF [bacterium]
QIGSELTRKGILSVALSLVGMLLYIWYRFELRYGIGALVAVFHDFLITLGLFALVNYEFNLPTIAAFLTLVGYSVNDTVVIFDRVRENRRRDRRAPLVNIMNKSLNQTLSRTILTSGTTLMVVGCLFFLGGEVIRGFAFVLLVGIVVGTYSSIFVASPFALLWERFFGREAREQRHRRGPGNAQA